MISLREIKIMAKKKGKRISRKAVERIDKMIENKMEEIIKKATRNADFAGRKTIKEQDIVEE